MILLPISFPSSSSLVITVSSLDNETSNLVTLSKSFLEFLKWISLNHSPFSMKRTCLPTNVLSDLKYDDCIVSIDKIESDLCV